MTTLLRRALFALAGRLPTRIIQAEQSEHDLACSPLFERGHLFTVHLPIVGEVTAYLHHYLRSDPDRGLHDHPWPWAIAVPLAGGYREERLTGMQGGHPRITVRRRLPFVPYRLSGTDFHRVLVANGATSWSLFITGANAFKPWGFLRPLFTGAALCGVHYVEHPSESAVAWWASAPLGRFHERAAP